MNKKVELNIEDIVDLEIKSTKCYAKLGDRGKTKTPDKYKSRYTYRNLNGIDKRIHQGYKLINEDEDE